MCNRGVNGLAGPLAIGTINPVSGVLYGVSTGTVTVVYTTGGICSTSETVTVSAAQAPILPTAPNVCVGSQITVTDATPGGSWSLTPVGVYASIGSSSGTVTGLFAGTPSIITYTAPSGCITTRGVTVNPLPGGITGITTICLGSTGPLFDLTAGGTLRVTSTTVATVNPVSGVVYGVSLGVDTVKYTLPTGCFVTTTVNVVPLPSPIVGQTNVCLGATGITYTDATIGGAWSVSNPTIAYVDVTGALTTYATGVDTIYYYNGVCSSALVMTVNPLPGPVTGIPQVCVGGTTTLSVPQPVTWTSSDTTKATVNPGTGVVTGISTGIVNITCTTTAGCILVTPIVVNPQPLPIERAYLIMCGHDDDADRCNGRWYFLYRPGYLGYCYAGRPCIRYFCRNRIDHLYFINYRLPENVTDHGQYHSGADNRCFAGLCRVLCNDVRFSAAWYLECDSFNFRNNKSGYGYILRFCSWHRYDNLFTGTGLRYKNIVNS